MSRFAKLADKPKETSAARLMAEELATVSAPAPSRIGRKAISGYFSPDMSLALHTCARRNGVSLQALMAEAFDDVLRKYGESPIGS
ncbi:ribbon-helix-helix domain-containing protein [Novosphingobium fuchskuhlense]|uniref:ribbon-helix-helix domain-containing protein n=1 Tax=Novosphingobium fuchskuhlense TaxID=1117702 RepID=UPI0009EB6376|nr:ribbon-helix-helix domain-containing protein [Novosphingobium fuchskuhlense]